MTAAPEATVPDADPALAPSVPGRWRRPVDRSIRVAGAVVAVALALLTGVLELVLVPLRVGGVPVGLCVLVAVVVNALLPRFTVAVTGARWPALLPFLAWLMLMLVAAGRTTEGDLLVSGGLGVLLNAAGSIAFGVALYRMILRSAGPAGHPPGRLTVPH